MSDNGLTDKDLTDTDLAVAAGQGDRDAFAALLDRHYEAIFRIAYRYLRNPEGAQDIAQDVCVALPKKLKSFRGEAKFTTWLYRVTVNSCLDRLRSERAQQQRAHGFAEVQTMAQADALEQDQASQWLYQALLQIDEPYRGTALLILGEDLTHKQAGEILEVRESTISWRMMEVRKMLKQAAQLETGEDA